MKKLLMLWMLAGCLFFMNLSVVAGQMDESVFSRKGKTLVEMALGTFGSFNSATGIDVLSNGGTVFGVGFSGGYFAGENIAAHISLYYSSTYESYFEFTVGPKFYIIEKIPFEISVGLGFPKSSDYFFLYKSNIGYAIKFNQHVYLEPNIGIIGSRIPLFQAGVRFALIL